MLSHYRLIEEIGAGGRGVVWRAEDTVLGRQVALKFIPDDIAHEREQLARFKREARLLASLNHPNVASIYGLEETDGLRCLVLELVPGQTLAERLANGALPVDEALRICREIAGALEAADGRRIIHRDLKPGNIKITPEGKVKVLDFGLAKSLHQSLSASELPRTATKILGQTREGVVLGTTPYMSPEQARGQSLDRRTDIWSFGCVLFEALTGRRAFQADTTSDTIAKILGEEPDWQALPAPTPAPARDLLKRCLRKDVDRRLRDFGDVRVLLLEAIEARPRAAALGSRIVTAAGGWRGLSAGTLLGFVTFTAGLLVWRPWRDALQAARPPVMFDFSLPTGVALPAFRSVNQFDALAISPDGSRLVFVGEQEGETRLYLRSLDRLRAEPIAGTEQGTSPFFSPDGQWLGFLASGKLKKVPAIGGPTVTLCDAASGLSGSWGPDGTIVFSDREHGLSRVPEEGGAVERLTRYDPSHGEDGYYAPQFLPGGQSVLFTIDLGTRLDQQVAVVSLRSGERTIVLQDAGPAIYLSSGHLLFLRAGRANAVRFDAKRMQVVGSSIPILGDLWLAFFYQSVQATVSGNGVLAYLPEESMTPDRRLVWVDRDGKAQPVTDLQRTFLEPRLSPDGSQIAVAIINERFGTDIWKYDLAHQALTQLTFDGRNGFPSWTPDGKHVAYYSITGRQRNLYWRVPDGRSPPERLTTGDRWQAPLGWSPDGRVLLYVDIRPETRADIWGLRNGGGVGNAPFPFLRTRFYEDGARFSPDGSWVAYFGDESGRDEVYVCEYPGCGRKVRISTGGGEDPAWTPDGRELIFRHQDEVYSVRVDHQERFKASAPRLLFRGAYDRTASMSNYDITRDGRRFLMIRSEPRDAPARIHVVLNWLDELQRSLPPRGR